MHSNKLNNNLLGIFEILSTNPKTNFYKEQTIKINASSGINLLKITPSSISIPIPDFIKRFFNHKSSLKNKIVNLNSLQKFIGLLSANDQIVRLNHIGFCYKTDSTNKELELIQSVVKGTSLHLYEEPSNDKAKWLFLGDLENWSDPLIEILPVEKSDDKWVEYWLPHIQIDIDTLLSAAEIENEIKNIFGNQIMPYRIVIEGIAYIVRCRLGVTDGVNINLDLATNERNTQFHREKILRKLV